MNLIDLYNKNNKTEFTYYEQVMMKKEKQYVTYEELMFAGNMNTYSNKKIKVRSNGRSK